MKKGAVFGLLFLAGIFLLSSFIISINRIISAMT
jgi:hypothetical protein